MVSEFLSCAQKGDDKSPCNVFLARAIKKVYGTDDFENPSKTGTYLDANEIAAYVATAPQKWTLLGVASNQTSLNEAQFQANHKKAVIAVYSSPPHGHVCLILPGNLTDSASWKLKVPNSASFFLDNPSQSYVGEPLSKAFANDKKDQVKLYGRN
jgi:hypothetical protein